MEYYSLWPYLIFATLFILFLEQITYLKKKSNLRGPSFVFPFIGSAVSLVKNPTAYWDNQSLLAKSSQHGVSVNYVIGKFIIFIRDTDLSHKIFANVRPDAFHLVGHPFGKKLFGDHNMIYMSGQEHKDLRRRIAPNFTPKALSIYTSIQQHIILKHLKSWLELDLNPIPLRFLCRDMNLETSQTVFVGPYLKQESIEKFNSDYNFFNIGLMKLPIDLPGFAFRKARVSVSKLVQTLSNCVEESKSNMKQGKSATCLIDFWMQENSNPSIEPNSSSTEIGGYLFDFLFAAQDASTSSLLWAVTLLDSHADILKKVRDEVSQIWSPNSNKLITYEQLKEMKYTEAVAKEVIRYRAPATMVPHIAGEEFQLTENYKIPKGTIVFPSVFESGFQGFTEPDRFDPDRFFIREEDRVYKKNYLVFGAGAHMCVGQRYAINHLVLFIALFTSLIDFKRVRSDGCDEMVYIPTICPKDDCRVILSQRCRFPNI